MKKLLGFYLPLLIAVGAGSFFTGSYLFNNCGVILKSVLGFGKIISSSKQTIIKANGFEVEHAKIFEADGIIYLVIEFDENSGKKLIKIDKKENLIALPGKDCHKVLFSNYLFLADCGNGSIYWSSGQSNDFQTGLKYRNQT